MWCQVARNWADANYDAMQSGEAFRLQSTHSDTLKSSVHSAVKHDLIGNSTAQRQLTRTTVGEIRRRIKSSAVGDNQVDQEGLLRNATRLINEQKATVVLDHLTYNAVD